MKKRKIRATPDYRRGKPGRRGNKGSIGTEMPYVGRIPKLLRDRLMLCARRQDLFMSKSLCIAIQSYIMHKHPDILHMNGVTVAAELERLRVAK